MNHPLFQPIRYPALCLLGAFASLSPVKAESQAGRTASLRILCVTVLPGIEEHVLGSANEDGELEEHGTVSLRSSFITEWLEIPKGDLQLCVREDGKLIPKCDFNYPKTSSHALLLLLPGEDEGQYMARVIDTTGQAFRKGEIMVINSSEKPVEVTLGEKRVEAKAGEHSVHKPTAAENGMFRRLVAYTDESGATVTVDDRYIQYDQTSREFLILIADPKAGIRVISMPHFGVFE